MAVRIAIADGNFTAAATWGVVDATALLDSEAASTALTTAYVESAGFTPGAITIDGIAVKVAARVASPTGTISIRLAQAGATVAGTEVTINVSDIAARATQQGWYLFKFAAPVLLLAATAYTVSAKCSVNGEATLYRNATAGNWSRLLRTTTTGAPGAGDSLHILGEWTAAATKTDRTVTMNETATTDYGDNTPANPPGFTIGNGGTLTWGVVAATNYILRLSTNLTVYYGGTLNMGTVASPIPRDSSHELQFDVGGHTDGDFGLRVFGTATFIGQSRTSGKDVSQCLLNGDEAAGQTVLSVDADTGWLNTDQVAIATTTRTASQTELRTLSGSGAADITITAGLTNAHGGTAPIQAEVILLQRNCRILSTSTLVMCFTYFGADSVVDARWTLFRYHGANALAQKRGVEFDTSAAGSLNMLHCCLRDFDNHGLFTSAADMDNVTVSHLVGYKVGHQASTQAGVRISATTGVNWSLADVTILSDNAASGYGVYLQDVGGTVNRLRCVAGGGVGISIDERNGVMRPGWSDFHAHGNGVAGLEILGLMAGRIDVVRAWRQNSASTGGGIRFVRPGTVTLVDGALFGNGSNNVVYDSTNFSSFGRWTTLRGFQMGGDTANSTAVGIQLAQNNAPVFLRLENCVLGDVTGVYVAHTSADLDLGTSSTPTGDKYGEIVLVDTLLDSGTEIANPLRFRANSYIAYQRADQATGVHKKYYPALGTVERETSVFHTASPSEKLTPSGAVPGLRLPTRSRFKVAVSGAPVTVSVWVRKSAAYTGSAPRLIIKANPAIGIDDDVVGATHSAAADTWEQLSYVTSAPTEDGAVEYYVDCDGSAGLVYADDWA